MGMTHGDGDVSGVMWQFGGAPAPWGACWRPLTCLPQPLAQLQAQKLRLAHSRGPYYSGSLPNVNQIGSGVSDFQVSSTCSAGRGLPW